MKYRVTTTDGFIFKSCRTRKEAQAAAEQQARQLQEVMLIERYDYYDGYVEIARVRG